MGCSNVFFQLNLPDLLKKLPLKINSSILFKRRLLILSVDKIQVETLILFEVQKHSICMIWKNFWTVLFERFGKKKFHSLIFKVLKAESKTWKFLKTYKFENVQKNCNSNICSFDLALFCRAIHRCIFHSWAILKYLKFAGFQVQGKII